MFTRRREAFETQNLDLGKQFHSVGSVVCDILFMTEEEACVYRTPLDWLFLLLPSAGACRVQQE